MKSTDDFVHFVSAPFFMVRVPLLSRKIFLELSQMNSDERCIELYHQLPAVQEAIFTASPSLYDALEQKSYEKDSKKKTQITSSLLRYMLRMATRATPFGLFAAVAHGNFSAQTQFDLPFSTPLFCRRARVDMHWLQQLVRSWEDDLQYVYFIPVQTSQLVIQKAERWTLDYQKEEGQERPCTISIRSTILTDFILEQARQPLLYCDLQKKILSHFHSLDSENLMQTLWSIFKKGFLKTAWLPHLLTQNPLKELIAYLSKIELSSIRPMIEKLKDIQKQLTLYNNSCLGQGIPFLKKAQQIMSQLHKQGVGIQVDSTLNTDSPITLPPSVSEEVVHTIDALWKLSPNKIGSTHLKEYHSHFIQKYGTRRLIPILEVLHKTTGIGVPPTYNGKFIEDTEEEENLPLQSFLIDQYTHCLTKKQQEIILTPELLAKVTPVFNDSTQAPLSLEIYCEILTSSPQALDDGDFTIVFGPNFGSGQAGSSFGRFLDIMPATCKKELKQLLQKEERLSPATEFIEVSYFPIQGKSANVAVHESFRKRHVNLDAISCSTDSQQNQLLLDDICLGATPERLYLFSRSLQQELTITSMNMLNFHLAPDAVRLMREISKENCRPLHAFSWGMLARFHYLPRVRYGKTVIFPAKWRILTELQGHSVVSLSKNQIIPLLQNWLQTWNVPRYVYLTVFDNRLLFDLENSQHLLELATVLKNQGQLVLAENLSLNESFWCRGPNGNYCAEFVIPLLRHPSLITPPLMMAPSLEVPHFQQRYNLVGDEWLYLKLFMPEDKEEEFLIYVLKPFADEITEQLLAKQWFFIRYYDDKAFQVRVRFHMPSQQMMPQLLACIQNWGKQLLAKGHLKDFSFHIYEREIERYGGSQCIALAENLFCIDSHIALQLIQWRNTHAASLPLTAVAALSFLDCIFQWDIGNEQMKNLLGIDLLPKELLSDLKPFEKIFQKLAWTLFYEKTVDDLAIISLQQIFALRAPFLQTYIQALNNRKKENIAMNDLFFIQQSIIHMHSNRLLGISSTKEQKARCYGLHLLKTFKFLKQAKADALL